MSIEVVNAHTGLTRITCSTCSIAYESVFGETEAHQEHFDPAEEIGWHRDAESREIVCPDCFQQQPKGDETNMTTTSETMSTSNGVIDGTASIPEPVKKRFRQRLRCALTADEKLERMQRADELEADIEAKEADFDAEKKARKAEIEKIQAARKEIVMQTRTGSVYREVACERRFDYRLGRVLEVRLDTGEITFERPMTGDERQPTLPIPGVASVEDEGELEEGGQSVPDDEDGDLEEGEDDGSDDSPGPRNWTPDETDEPDGPMQDTEHQAEPVELPEPVLETARGRKGGRKGSKKSKAASAESES